MNTWWICYLPLILLLFIFFRDKKETGKYIEAKIKRRNGDKEMQELAKRFIGKDVLVNTISSGTADGILKEVSDNAIVIEKSGKDSVINLDYVIKIREYPTNKNGKRKSVVTE